MSLSQPLFSYYVNLQKQIELEHIQLTLWADELLKKDPSHENIRVVNQAFENFDYRKYKEWSVFFKSDLWQVEELR